jgi:hypothetical protein
LLATQRVHCKRKLEKFDKKKVSREVAEIRRQSVEEEGDGFIEKDCSVDWASPPIYDTYPDEEVSSIHQVDFLGTYVILSKTFNQSCDEIYGVEMTFLSKSEGVFWEFSWLMGRVKHKRSTTNLHSKVACGAFTTNIKVCQR